MTPVIQQILTILVEKRSEHIFPFDRRKILKTATLPVVAGRRVPEFYLKVILPSEGPTAEDIATMLFEKERALFQTFEQHSPNTERWVFTTRGEWIHHELSLENQQFFCLVSLSDRDGWAMMNTERAVKASRAEATFEELSPAPAQVEMNDSLKLPSRFQPGDLVVYHVFGGDKWISGCVVKRVGFTDNGKVIYNLHVPVEFEGRDPIYCPVNDVPSEWVVSRIGEKNLTVLVKDELRIKTTNED